MKKKRKEKKTEDNCLNKMALHMYLSVITLNVNVLNAPTKRQRVAEWIRKQDPYMSQKISWQ